MLLDILKQAVNSRTAEHEQQKLFHLLRQGLTLGHRERSCWRISGNDHSWFKLDMEVSRSEAPQKFVRAPQPSGSQQMQNGSGRRFCSLAARSLADNSIYFSDLRITRCTRCVDGSRRFLGYPPRVPVYESILYVKYAGTPFVYCGILF